MLQKHCLSRTLLLPTLLSLSLCMGGCGWKQSTEKSVPDPKLSTQEKKNTPVSDGLLAHLTFDEALSATSGQDATEHFRYTITNGKTNKIKESVGPGLFKNALQCDGRTFASIPDLAPYAINRENQGAISVWFYADAEQVSLRNVILSLTNQWGL
ncbi:TPA: hypothetical protein DDW35_07260, partial [Candidatus Sumerlaeota bacterium]|nr:hypothetical protein [Candidatus Sumerlaeota bacterium]